MRNLLCEDSYFIPSTSGMSSSSMSGSVEMAGAGGASASNPSLNRLPDQAKNELAQFESRINFTSNGDLSADGMSQIVVCSLSKRTAMDSTITPACLRTRTNSLAPVIDSAHLPAGRRHRRTTGY